jgi:iron(III) transport system ATP-binding protein
MTPPSPDIAVPTVGIRIEQVNLSYGDNHVLRSIDLDIRPGELFAFLGPSGCGKTTLLRLIAGFNRADSGRVLVGGNDISALPPWKRDIGMVFQSYALWPHMTVARNVAFGLEEKRVPHSQIGPRVAANRLWNTLLLPFRRQRDYWLVPDGTSARRGGAASTDRHRLAE